MASRSGPRDTDASGAEPERPDTTAAPPSDSGGRRGGLLGRVDRIKIPAKVLSSAPFRAAAPRVLPVLHRAVHRLSGGRLFDTTANPMCLLTTTGAKSGRQRETPLAAVPVEDGRLLVVGSNFASERHPAWTSNLLAEPRATVTFRGETYPVVARLLAGEERAQRWEELVRWYPNWRDYSTVTDREFRVFQLDRG